MHIPIRCFSCGKPIGHLWEEFHEKVNKASQEQADAVRKKFLDEKGLVRYCCRATLMTHVELDEVARFKKF